MQVNPYLFYDGNCEAAFKYYEKVLGARIEAMMTWADAPPEMAAAPDLRDKVMHARLTIDGEVIMAGDAPPAHVKKPEGFAVSLQVEDPADAERRFNALADGGSVTMPFSKTFFSNGFGMCIDQFGIPWMVNCPKEGI
jgi:PhnB protein